MRMPRSMGHGSAQAFGALRLLLSGLSAATIRQSLVWLQKVYWLIIET